MCMLVSLWNFLTFLKLLIPGYINRRSSKNDRRTLTLKRLHFVLLSKIIIKQVSISIILYFSLIKKLADGTEFMMVAENSS